MSDTRQVVGETRTVRRDRMLAAAFVFVVTVLAAIWTWAICTLISLLS